jgi:hypothetical protein
MSGIENRRRDQLLSDVFAVNEEILINARQLVAELQEKDRLAGENKILRDKLELARMFLSTRQNEYRRYDLSMGTNYDERG